MDRNAIELILQSFKLLKSLTVHSRCFQFSGYKDYNNTSNYSVKNINLACFDQMTFTWNKTNFPKHFAHLYMKSLGLLCTILSFPSRWQEILKTLQSFLISAITLCMLSLMHVAWYKNIIHVYTMKMIWNVIFFKSHNELAEFSLKTLDKMNHCFLLIPNVLCSLLSAVMILQVSVDCSSLFGYLMTCSLYCTFTAVLTSPVIFLSSVWRKVIYHMFPS